MQISIACVETKKPAESQWETQQHWSLCADVEHLDVFSDPLPPFDAEALVASCCVLPKGVAGIVCAHLWTRVARLDAQAQALTVVAELSREGQWLQHPQGWSRTNDGPRHLLLPTPVYCVSTDSGVYVRSRADPAATVLRVLPFGAPLLSLERQERWIRHAHGWSLSGDGREQWISVAERWRVVYASGIWIRSGPSTTTKKLGRLQPDHVVLVWDRSGPWLRHALGWSLSTDDVEPLAQRVDPAG